MKKLRAACLLGLVRSLCAGLLLGPGGPPAARAATPATAPGPSPVAVSVTASVTASVTIAAARLLDVDTGHYLDRPLVRIDGGTVTEVRQRRPGEPVTFDLGDQTLLPGLIDCHTHLVGGEEQTPYDSLRQTAARAAIEGVANARATLYAGFTTVRDLGSRDLADVALRDAISAGRIPGPRMFVAVSSVSSTGGHGDWNDLPPDNHLKDGGRYRRRRHSCFVVDAGHVTQVPHRAHWQPVSYNALHGGIERWFEPLEPALAGELGRTPEAVYKSLQRIRRTLLECIERKIAEGEA